VSNHIGCLWIDPFVVANVVVFGETAKNLSLQKFHLVVWNIGRLVV
jgi:hypothetical protein